MCVCGPIPNGGEERVAVFNSLGFPNTGYVQLSLEDPATTPRVVDVESRRPAPSQVWESGTGKVLRFKASLVPAMGYKSYRIEAGGPAAVGAAVCTDPARGRSKTSSTV